MSETIVLRGVEVELTSPTGHKFVVDAVRAAEGLISDRELAEIYEISPEDWRDITKNSALVNAIRDERARRVRSGVAAQEAAAKEFATAPQILGKLLHGDVHPKHAVDIHRELRATAHGSVDGERAADTEKFTIIIDLGTDHVERYEKEIAPMKPLVPVIESRANDNDDE
jgi:hypothetical protein